jgi:predicted ATPase
METIFVGREQEQKRLNDLFSKALKNSLQICFISGEQGDGKTTLAEYFANSAQKQHPETIQAFGSCQEITKEKSYKPFQDIFSKFTGVRVGEIRSALGSNQELEIKQKIQVAIKILLASTPDLIGLLVPPVALLTKVVGVASDQIIQNRIEASKLSSITEERLRDQSKQFFTELSEKSPIIMIFDDVQWIDMLSLKLIRNLQSDLVGLRILMILTFRPREIPQELQGWIEEINQHTGEAVIDLHADHGETRGIEFIQGFLQQNNCDVDAEFVKHFYQRTEGKPLYAEELLQYLKNSGVLTINTLGLFEEEPLMKQWAQLPTRITRLEALIDSRLKLLDAELTEILNIAGIEGFEFTAQVITELTNKSEKAVLEALSNILDKQYGLVREVGEENIGSVTLSRFRFSNILYQERIYNNMASSLRSYWHRNVAVALERLYSDDLGQAAVFLGKHYERANRPREASRYLIMLGKQQIITRRTHEGIEILERALALARNSKYMEGIVDALSYIGMELVEKMNFIDGEIRIQEAIKLSREHQQLHALGISLRALGRIRTSQSRYSEAMYSYMEALNIANQINELGLAGACLNNIGLLAAGEGRHNDAVFFFNQRLDIATQLGDDDGKIIAYINWGDSARILGENLKSRELLMKGLEIASARKDWFRECGINISLAYLDIEEGNLRSASQLIIEVLYLAKVKDHKRRRVQALICAASIFARTKFFEITIKVLAALNTTKDGATIEIAERSRIKKYLMSRLINPENIGGVTQSIDISVEELQNEIEPMLLRFANGL